MTLHALLVAVGGRSALTRWSLIVAMPLGVVSGILWGAARGFPLVPWALAMCLLHASLAFPFLLFRRGLRSATTRGPRPWLAMGAFAILGALRAAGVMAMGGLFGLPDAARLSLQSVPYGAITGVITFGTIAIVVDGVREHRATMQRLAALDASIARSRALDEGGFERLEAQLVDEVQQALARELDRLRASDSSNQAAAAALRAMATDVVRPLSHRLARDEHDFDERAIAGEVAAERHVTQRASARLLVAETRPANPLLIFVLIALIGVPAEFVVPRAGSALSGSLIVLLGGAVMYALSWVLARLWPPGPTTVVRLLALVAAYFAIGAVAAGVMAVAGIALVGKVTSYEVTPILLTLIAVGLSMLGALAVRRTANEDRLADYVIRDARLAVHVRERYQRAQRRVAKFLHSHVQAQLIASAMSLSLASPQTPSGKADGRFADEVEQLARSIDEQLRPPTETSLSSKQRVHDLTSLWGGVLLLDIAVPDDVWDALDADPDALSAVEDVVSEGLTNAVRHGEDRRVVLTLFHRDGEIDIVIRSTGHLSASAQPGLGSQFLTDATAAWSLVEAEGRVHLTATIRTQHDHANAGRESIVGFLSPPPPKRRSSGVSGGQTRRCLDNRDKSLSHVREEDP
jgi:signal transduction histidine kinase